MNNKFNQSILTFFLLLSLVLTSSVVAAGKLTAEAAFSSSGSSSSSTSSNPGGALVASATQTSTDQNNYPFIKAPAQQGALSALADTAVEQGTLASAAIFYTGSEAIFHPQTKQISNVNNIKFKKCTFGVSVLDGDSSMPFSIPALTEAYSMEIANPIANNTSFTTAPTTNFNYKLGSEYYVPFSFTTPTTYAKIGVPTDVDDLDANLHDTIAFSVASNLSAFMQIGQRFAVDGFVCEVTVTGWSGTFYFGDGKNLGSVDPLITYIVTANATSSASSSSTSSALPQNERIDLYRFYKPSTGGHLYTVSESEKNKVINTLSYLFNYEKVRGQVLPANTPVLEPDMVQIERFYNYASGTHLYTYKPEVITSLKKNKNFKAEGPRFTAFYKAKTGRLPMYEFYNKSTGGYFYTSSESEKNKVKNNLPQFSYRGIVFYVLPRVI